MPRHPPNALTRLIQSPNLAHREQAPRVQAQSLDFRQLSTHVLPAWPRLPVPSSAHPQRRPPKADNRPQPVAFLFTMPNSRGPRTQIRGQIPRTAIPSQFVPSRGTWRTSASHRRRHLPSSVLRSLPCDPAPGGADRDRTGDLLLAKQALSQLSYGPDSKDRDQRTQDSPMRGAKTLATTTSVLRPLISVLWHLVGQGRFELPTSRLSSARSNQLSY